MINYNENLKSGEFGNSEKTNSFLLSRIKGNGLKINEFKEIIKMVTPIFIQLVFGVLISQINLMIINWYHSGIYADAISRATLAYAAFQFIPAFVAVGSIISCGKIIGQNKKEDLSKVIVTGIFVNIIISGTLILFLNLIANFMCSIVSPSEEINVIDKKLIINFYKILNIQLLFSSILQVLSSPLQTLNKSIHIAIGAILSNIIDIVFVLLSLYVFKLNILCVAASISIALCFQIIYLLILNFKYVNFKINKRKQLSKYYAKEIILSAAPITCEMMIMCMATLVVSSCMARIELGVKYGKDSAVTIYRNLNSIVQYLSAFSAALGTVSSVFVSRKIGAKDIQGAYESALDCWKLGIYMLIILTVIFVIMTYPILKLFNTTDLIAKNKIGYIFIFLTCIWQLFDVSNLTLLRALWSSGDLITPIFVSIFTMGIAYVLIPCILVYWLKFNDMNTLITILSCMIIDPLSRTIVYITKWTKGWWIKKIL